MYPIVDLGDCIVNFFNPDLPFDDARDVADHIVRWAAAATQAHRPDDEVG
jgi:hypothetical protein